jgi:DNA (cytosine-5)-methyltransferase 1
LEDCLERDSPMVNWNSRDETSRLIAMMTDTNRHKLERARASGRRVVGAAFRRTRRDALGRAVQRLEIRFDGQAGCLRTPAGGSSRQIVIEIDGERVRTRLMTPRETARLMGLSDDYRLPDNANEAYHLIGDGVVVPVVAHLERHLLRPPACASGERSSDVAWASRP